MGLDLEALFQVFGELMDGPSMTDALFGDRFRRMMRALVTFDDVVVFAYRAKERPLDLYSTFGPQDHVIFISLYQEGPYLLDPFYRVANERGEGVWRMRELAPDRFYSSEYYRSYYIQTRLAEEIGFFVLADDEVTVVLSLMRREGSGPFSAAEVAMLRKVEPLVAAMVRRCWSGLGRRFDAATHRRRRTPSARDRPESGSWRGWNLTNRELAIVELVLQGHSSESIGLRLQISTGTVKVHRRNVYRKLGISSQTQLLSLYLTNLP